MCETGRDVFLAKSRIVAGQRPRHLLASDRSEEHVRGRPIVQ